MNDRYKACYISDEVGGKFELTTMGKCRSMRTRTNAGGNNELVGSPPIEFYSDDTPTDFPVFKLDDFASKRDDFLVLDENLKDSACDKFPPQKYKESFFAYGTFDGEYYAFDPQIVVRENTLEDPLENGGGDLLAQTALDNINHDEDFRVSCRYVKF